MNEKIQKLLSKAITDVHVHLEDPVISKELEEMFIPDCFAEKFTELLINMCIEDVINQQSDLFNSNASKWQLGLRVKEHFGVK